MPVDNVYTETIDKYTKKTKLVHTCGLAGTISSAFVSIFNRQSEIGRHVVKIEVSESEEKPGSTAGFLNQ